jgi:hypothetical protein
MATLVVGVKREPYSKAILTTDERALRQARARQVEVQRQLNLEKRVADLEAKLEHIAQSMKP